MAYADLDGCRIWYELKGSGDYLLQIPGMFFAHANFGRVTDAMAEHFTVIDFDQRGTGLSDRPSQRYSIELWAEDCALLLDALGVERAHVHGTSAAGMVAIRFAAEHPQRVDRLVIDCSAAKLDFVGRAMCEVWKALAHAYGLGSRELALNIASQACSRAFLDGDEGAATVESIRELVAQNCTPETFSAVCDAMIEVDLTADLGRIRAPTLVTVGDQDVMTPIDQGPQGVGNRAIAEGIPGARLHVMEGIGHANLLEAPELTTRVVLEFLKLQES
jgi:3-oxoadipate enol-lactonase